MAVRRVALFCFGALTLTFGCGDVPAAQDTADARPDVECFGGSIRCDDSVVRFDRSYTCRLETYECSKGCRKDDGARRVPSDPASACEESRPKLSGDTCLANDDCVPSAAALECVGGICRARATTDAGGGDAVVGTDSGDAGD